MVLTINLMLVFGFIVPKELSKSDCTENVVGQQTVNRRGKCFLLITQLLLVT